MSDAETLRRAATEMRQDDQGPVILAVADWLDTESRLFEAHLISASIQTDSVQAVERGVAHLHRHALAVAHAYLSGEPA